MNREAAGTAVPAFVLDNAFRTRAGVDRCKVASDNIRMPSMCAGEAPDTRRQVRNALVAINRALRS
jgi:hypothetical protein